MSADFERIVQDAARATATNADDTREVLHKLTKTERMVPEWAHNQMLAALNNEGPLARMAREVEDDFDRQAVRAITAALPDMPRLWPGPTLGGVSGDAIAGAKAARKFSTPEFDLWEQVRAPDRLHRQFQRYTDANGNPPGDCWRTALACLIQVPRDEVPHFIHEYPGHKVGPRGTLSTPLWWVKSVEWVEQQRPGWTLENYAPQFPVYDGDDVPSRVIISGQSPRGDWLHAVIVDSVTGDLVHDVHPSGAGVLDQQEMAVLVPVAP